MNRPNEWWHEFFPAFRPLFSKITAQETNAQVRFLIKEMGLRPGQRFLDCPCGVGRVSLPLARAGIRVTGVDITPGYLEELARKAKRARLKVETAHADMRRINYDRQFDAGGNLWTSFGFFEDERDHLVAVKKMYRALKPGGKFALHVINRDWIMVNFQSRGWDDFPKGKVLEERQFDYECSVIRSKWHFIVGGEEQTYEVPLRIFSLHEMMDLFRRAGFEQITAYGSEKREPVDRRKRMMWVIGTRPKES